MAASVRYDVLEARMAAMTPEERAAFVAKAAGVRREGEREVGFRG
ncbi:MAG: hypothetical protein ACLSGS_03310 [Adlercreutzia sp.]